MMNIREYIETIDEEERDEIAETLYAVSQDDPEDFESWAIENGVDLTAIDPDSGEYVTVLWGWDMCEINSPHGPVEEQKLKNF